MDKFVPFTAVEAYAKSKANDSYQFYDIMNKIFDQIKEEAGKGKYKINVTPNLTEKEIEYLKQLGYILMDNGAYYVIDWSDVQNE